MCLICDFRAPILLWYMLKIHKLNQVKYLKIGQQFSKWDVANHLYKGFSRQKLNEYIFCLALGFKIDYNVYWTNASKTFETSGQLYIFHSAHVSLAKSSLVQQLRFHFPMVLLAFFIIQKDKIWKINTAKPKFTTISEKWPTATISIFVSLIHVYRIKVLPSHLIYVYIWLL